MLTFNYHCNVVIKIRVSKELQNVYSIKTYYLCNIFRLVKYTLKTLFTGKWFHIECPLRSLKVLLK